MKFSLLDGGMGHLIKEKGIRIQGLPYDQQFLAGIVATVENPQEIEECHRQYLQAGADVITTNSYSATHYSLEKIGWQDRKRECIQVRETAFCEMGQRL